MPEGARFRRSNAPTASRSTPTVTSTCAIAAMTERGADNLIANPDMCLWKDHIIDLDREKRYWKPSAVKVDDVLRLCVIDAGRYRMQVYRKKFPGAPAGPGRTARGLRSSEGQLVQTISYITQP